mmetsp:Transcript_15500/g.34221  ORF Transcript_15500/g.34221 Transcript_15500/m.34221 type:complete len:277 (-) Transcript_15500:405-1235(-)
MHRASRLPMGCGEPTKAHSSTGITSGTRCARVYAIDFLRFANSSRPSLMPTTMEAKLSSSSTMSAASLATSDPFLPMAMPIAACFRAGESFTPSPVMAVMFPALVNSFTIISFCSGLVRAKTISFLFTSTAQSSSVMSAMCPPCTTTAPTSSSGTDLGSQPLSLASTSRVGRVIRPILRAMAAAVSGWSPVTITTFTKAEWHSFMACGTSGLGGSISVTRPMNMRLLMGRGVSLPIMSRLSSSVYLGSKATSWATVRTMGRIAKPSTRSPLPPKSS